MKTAYMLMLAVVLCAGNVYAMGNRANDSSREEESAETPSTVSQDSQIQGQEAYPSAAGEDIQQQPADPTAAGQDMQQADPTAAGETSIPGSAATEDQRPGSLSTSGSGEQSVQEDPALRPAGSMNQ
jgi:hypothetical protein